MGRAATRALSVFMASLIAAIVLLGLCAALGGCAKGIVEDGLGHGEQRNVLEGQVGCHASAARYPTTVEDFADAHLLYGHRGFLDVFMNVKHLGRDIVYAEGAAMHPIACGTLRFYGPANGYGTLVAVVEHELDTPLVAMNGEGQTVPVSHFLSIYGHLRDSRLADGTGKLGWQVGDTVAPGDTVGYIQADAYNGDGPEHLHLGIRLQNAADAKASDAAWFRGYDSAGEGNFKKYYADPKEFVPALIALLGQSGQPQPAEAGAPLVTVRHPIGTLLDVQGAKWLVVESDSVVNVSGAKKIPVKCAVAATPEEIACYWQLAAHPLVKYLDAKAVKFDGQPQVHQMYPAAGPTAYRTFISYDAFLSWGYSDADIEHRPLADKPNVMNGVSDHGLAGFMPGALAKGNGQSEIAVADQNGLRRPLFNWDVFVQLGYDQACVYGIDAATLDAVAGPRSDDLITLADAVECSANGEHHACDPGTTVPCGCAGNVPGTQTCEQSGKRYADCVCQGGGGGTPIMCGTYAVGEVVDSPCCPPDGATGKQKCQANGAMSDCYACPEAPTDAGTGGSSGQTESGAGGSPEGTGGAAGSGGIQNQDAQPDDDLVRIEYYGLPQFANYGKGVDAWFAGHPWDTVAGCTAAAAQDIVCEFHAPHGSQLLFQVSVGATRFWGDASGLAPAPCVPAAQVQGMSGPEIQLLGTAKLFVNGQPFAFGLQDNDTDDPNDNGVWCGAAQKPYFNGHAKALP